MGYLIQFLSLIKFFKKKNRLVGYIFGSLTIFAFGIKLKICALRVPPPQPPPKGEILRFAKNYSR